MQELEKILEEIDREVEEYMKIDFSDEYNAGFKDMAYMAKKIIRKHLTVQLKPDKQHNKVSQRAFEKFKGLLEEGADK